MNYDLHLSNISCSSCVKTIETALASLPEIEHFQVSFTQRLVTIRGSATPDMVIQVIKEAGYQATYKKNKEETQEEEKIYWRTLIYQTSVAAILGLFLLLLGWNKGIPSLDTSTGRLMWRILGFISACGIWYAGAHFYQNAYHAFINHHATMDTLIALGTFAAWTFSMIVTLFPHLIPPDSRHVYFEASLIIIAWINLGKLLEMRARGKTSQAITQLIGLQAKTARRVHADGSEEEVAIASLQVGHLIRVLPGDKIPVDGVITTGNSTIDESMLTGESMPISKHPNDEVFGSTLNKTGSFLFKASKVGKETVLAQIIALVQNAQNTKPPIAKLADIVCSYFVPVVLVISLITALIWFNLGFSAGFILVTSITVLVIACPCALGLASPISVIVGMGKSAEYGILIRNGEALQNTSQVTTVILDKTGTITKGKPTLLEIITDEGIPKNRVLQLAASLEKHSEHPLAEAIIEKATHEGLTTLDTTHFESITGHGIQGSIEQQHILLGNDKLMRQYAISIDHLKKDADHLSSLGHTVIYLAQGEKLLGIISVADPIKPDTHDVILTLQKMGLQVIMITGDNRYTAQAIAQQIGIDNFFAEVLPAEKADEIRKLQESNEVVAMVGDGINDAPALVQADVGFAIGAGSDIAIESADVTLIGTSIQGIVNGIAISQATMRNIKQNLFGAFIYNVIGIPIAAGILYPLTGILLNPMIAGAAMAASSITVITNANRLRLFKTQEHTQ